MKVNGKQQKIIVATLIYTNGNYSYRNIRNIEGHYK